MMSSLIYIADLAGDLGLKWPSRAFSEWLRKTELEPVSSDKPFAFDRDEVLRAIEKVPNPRASSPLAGRLGCASMRGVQL